MKTYIVEEIDRPFKEGDVAILDIFGLATVKLVYDTLCFVTVPRADGGKGSITAPLHNFPEAKPLSKKEV